MIIYKDVRMVLVVICVMDGNNNLIIHYIIRLLNVNKNNVGKDHVLIIILKNKKELLILHLLQSPLNLHLKIE
jgi:hypothetical protein